MSLGTHSHTTHTAIKAMIPMNCVLESRSAFRTVDSSKESMTEGVKEAGVSLGLGPGRSWLDAAERRTQNLLGQA